MELSQTSTELAEQINHSDDHNQSEESSENNQQTGDNTDQTKNKTSAINRKYAHL